jgi:hypothetical protein
MDMYANLEYKCHQDMATNVRLWVDANPKKMFFFQQKVIASTSTRLKFSIKFKLLPKES